MILDILQIVAALAPLILLGVNFGTGSGSVSSKFRRAGTSQTNQSRSLPSYLSSLIQSNLSTGDIGTGLSGAHNSFLSDLLNTDFSAPLQSDKLTNILALSPNSYTGSGAVSSIAQIDPFAVDYLTQLEAFYDDTFDKAAAAARTGPDAVRGGVAHGAIAEGDVLERAALNKFRELNQIQQTQAGLTTDAAKAAGALEGQRRGDVLAAQNNWVTQFLAGLGVGADAGQTIDARRQGLAAGHGVGGEMVGSKVGLTTDDLTGQGLQNSSHSGWQAGFQPCCFIFLEALNGKLPWYVRRARDEMCTPERVVGYRKMSRWLVPMMQEHSSIKRLVNLVMIKPFLKWGAVLYEVDGFKRRWRVWKPLCQMWFKIWDRLGG